MRLCTTRSGSGQNAPQIPDCDQEDGPAIPPGGWPLPIQHRHAGSWDRVVLETGLVGMSAVCAADCLPIERTTIMKRNIVPIVALMTVSAMVAMDRAVAAPAEGRESPAKEVTPLSLPGSEAFVFRKINDVELRLHVVKPSGWTKSDKRSCFVTFFGGGWSGGTPERSMAWAKWAAAQGMVGVAPDYRTRGRFNGSPEDCVADGRAALRWVTEHAEELGIDVDKIVCHGGSAGGHLAAWTAIPKPGPGADDPAPAKMPAALILLNPVSDTNATGYGGPKRFGGDEARAKACSVPDQMPKQMPPTLIFHATGDTTVPHANSVALRDKMQANGVRCELVTFEGLGHSYNSSKFGEAGLAANRKTRADMIAFLRSLNLLAPDAKAGAAK